MDMQNTGEGDRLSSDGACRNPSAVPVTATNGLPGLPAELLESIADCFSAPYPSTIPEPQAHRTSTRDLYNLALTCKPLSLAARSCLYRNIVVRNWETTESASSSHLLACTLCESPWLGLLIRSIIALPCRERDFDAHYHVHEALEDMIMPLCEVSMAFQNILRAFHRRCAHADLVVIILKAPRLASLWIMNSHHRECQPPSTDRLVRSWNAPTKLLEDFLLALRLPQIGTIVGNGVLTRLKYLKFTGHGADFREKQMFTSGLLNAGSTLPAIQTLSARGVTSDRIARWCSMARASTITDLSLIQSDIHENTLDELITGCKKLSRFAYAIEDPSTELESVSVPILSLILLQHRESLVCLCLSNPSNRGEAWDTESGSTSWTEFRNLTTLEVDEQLLVGDVNLAEHDLTRLLPASLRNLKIDTFGHISKLDSMLLRLDSLLPQGLDTLRISFPLYWKEYRGHRRLNTEYMHMFRHAETMTCGHRPYFLVLEHRAGGKRIELQTWDLQEWQDGLTRLTVETRRHGIKRLVELQLPNIWDSDSVLGEALMENFESTVLAVELAGSQRGDIIEDVGSAPAVREAP